MPLTAAPAIIVGTTSPVSLTSLPIEICREIMANMPEDSGKHGSLLALAQSSTFLRSIFLPMQWARVRGPDPTNPRLFGGPSQLARTIRFLQGLLADPQLCTYIRDITINFSGCYKNNTHPVLLFLQCWAALPHVHSIGLLGCDTCVTRMFLAAMGDVEYPAIHQLTLTPSAYPLIPSFPSMRSLILARSPKISDWEPREWQTRRYLDPEDDTFVVFNWIRAPGTPAGDSEMPSLSANTEAVRFHSRPSLDDISTLSELPRLCAIDFPCRGVYTSTSIGYCAAPEDEELFRTVKYTLRRSPSAAPRRLTVCLSVEPIETEWEKYHIPWMAQNKRNDVVFLTELFEKDQEEY